MDYLVSRGVEVQKEGWLVLDVCHLWHLSPHHYPSHSTTSQPTVRDALP